MNLTEHFTKEELVYSDTAKRLNISNEPPMIHEGTLKHTCQYLLEPLRALLNIKYVGRIINNKVISKVIIKITSGYRSQALNQALKKQGLHPAENSQHCSGEAADIEVIFIFKDGSKQVLNYMALFADINQFVNDGLLSVDQCIQEKQGNAVWVHASYSILGSSKNRNKFLKLSY